MRTVSDEKRILLLGTYTFKASNANIIDTNMNDSKKLLESVKVAVLEFLNGNTTEAEKWYQEAEIRGKETMDSDPIGQKLELERYTAVALGMMLEAARLQQR